MLCHFGMGVGDSESLCKLIKLQATTSTGIIPAPSPTSSVSQRPHIRFVEDMSTKVRLHLLAQRVKSRGASVWDRRGFR